MELDIRNGIIFVKSKDIVLIEYEKEDNLIDMIINYFKSKMRIG